MFVLSLCAEVASSLSDLFRPVTSPAPSTAHLLSVTQPLKASYSEETAVCHQLSLPSAVVGFARQPLMCLTLSDHRLRVSHLSQLHLGLYLYQIEEGV